METRKVLTLNRPFDIDGSYESYSKDYILSLLINEKKKNKALENQNQILREELQEKHLVFNEILESSLAGYWDWDIKNDHEFLSSTFKKMFGYEEHELKNHPSSWQKIIHPEDLKKALEIYKDHVESHGRIPYDCEVRYFHKNGSIVWVYCRGKVVEWDRAGNPVRMIGTHIDITALKKAQCQLEEQNHELQKLNTALDKFIYSISHDLRAPVASALGLITISKKEDDIEKIQQYIDLKEKCLKKLDSFIQDILHYSRNSRQDIQNEKVDFKTLINDAFERHQLMTGPQDQVRKVLEIQEKKDVYSDSKRVSIILNNLVSNALKYTNSYQEHPFVKIVVKTVNDQVQIKVCDNGIGISEEHREKIFDMFYRASEESHGAGLGLYIVKEIVEKLKGSIKIESSLGKGTCAVVSLPNLNEEKN